MTTTRRAGRGIGAAVTISAAMAAPAFAQMSAPAASDPVVLQPMTVTATKTAHQPGEVPANVSIIDSEAIESRSPSKIDDLLRDLPGVEMQGGPRRVGQDINIRGFGGQRVVTTLDGARQNFDAGHKGRFFLDPDLLRQIDVVRGSNSALHGSGAIGGVVAMETREAADFLDPGQSFGFRTKYGYSSVARENYVSVGAFGRYEDKADILGNFSYRDSGTLKLGGDVELPNSAEDLKDILLKATLTPFDHHKLSLSYIRFKEDGVQPINPDGTPNLTDNPIVDRETRMSTYALNYAFADPSVPLIAPTLRLYRNALEVDERRLVPATPARFDETELTTWGFDLYNTARFATGPLGHALTAGVEYFKNDQSGRRNGAARPAYPSAEGNVTGYYIQDEIEVARGLHLIPGFRYDTFESSAAVAADTEEDAVSPRIGATWQALPWLNLYGSYGRAFRAPSLTELYVSGSHFGPQNLFVPNPNLRPEKTETFEGGIRLQFRDVAARRDDLRLNATYFHTSADDFIETVVTITNPRTLAGSTTNTNIPEATIEGFELGVSYDMPWAFANLGYSRIRGDNDRTGRPLDSIPADKVVVAVGAKARALGIRAGWRSEIVADQDRVSGTPFVPGTAATPTTPGYTVHGIFLTWSPAIEWLSGFRIDAGIENIFDKSYRRHLASINEEGRDYRVAVSYTKGF